MQEDSYYSQYLAVQQQTRKVGTDADQIIQLREMLVSSQAALSSGLAALDNGLAAIRTQLPDTVRPGGEKVAEDVVEVSERVLAEARSRLLPTRIDVFVNDLLPMYHELLRRWDGTRIQVARRFGSSSLKATAPVYSVVAFERGVSAEALSEVCKSVAETGEWYLEFADQDSAVGNIYVGAYGYGGGKVMPLKLKGLRTFS